MVQDDFASIYELTVIQKITTNYFASTATVAKAFMVAVLTRTSG